jgi:outer membrane lipopolysaccharide assembly protein LptE/RlpB
LRLAFLLLAASLSGCGYHVVGTADALPKNIHTIAIPPVKNTTTQYKLSDQLGTFLTREFISRTRYKTVVDPKDADAVLSCGVVNFVSYPTIFDPNAGRATGVQVIVTVNVTLRDKAGVVLFTRPNFEVRERYEISIDPKSYFDENEPATQRLAQDIARTVVSAVLEKF